MKQWFALTPAENGNPPEVFIYDEIGDGDYGGPDSVTVRSFVDAARSLGDAPEIVVRINSPGGEVFAGSAIYNFLKEHRSKIVVRVDGLAGSIASIVAMAGDEVVMPRNSCMFIHNPLTGLVGNAHQLRKEADDLEKVEVGMIAAYREKTGLSDAEIKKIMDEDTFLTPEEAVEKGFADRIAESVNFSANHSVKAVKLAAESKLSVALREKDTQIQALTERLEKVEPKAASASEIIQRCAQAGIGTTKVAAWIEQGMPMDKVDQHLAFASAIRDRCAAAHISAAPFLAHCDDPAQVFGVALAERLAAHADGEHIDNTIPVDIEQPDQGWGKALKQTNERSF